ncbi:MAG TPA: hypothetical protein PK637_04805, partial [Flavobacteriales bacterium]|nr:hypothetical protein [Flavobacteriales bacterium]
MKKLLFLSATLMISYNSYCQLFGESITAYGIKFTAKEVTGQSKFNTSADLFRTKILDPLYETTNKEYLNRLGTYRVTIGSIEP